MICADFFRFVRRFDADLTAALMPAVGLTQFAVRFRYPGEDQPTREEALPWLGLARSVCQEVLGRIPVDPAVEAAPIPIQNPATPEGEPKEPPAVAPGEGGNLATDGSEELPL